MSAASQTLASKRAIKNRSSRGKAVRPSARSTTGKASGSRTAVKKLSRDGGKKIRARLSVKVLTHRGVVPPKSRPRAADAPLPPPAPRLADGLSSPQAQDAFSEMPAAGEMRLVFGRSGDHAGVYHMLLAVFQAPSREEFHAQTEDPFYEPSDRLLVKRGHRVISHVQLTKRTMQFGQLSLPVAGFHWLATLPEFRSQGLATRLLAEGEKQVAAGGAVLAVTRTNVPRFFARAGWAVCGRHSFSQAKAREVLARLHGEHAPRLAKRLNIRQWRHVEMPALMRIYKQNTAEGYGPIERTEAYWRWLITRGAFDSLLIALDGPDKLDLEETRAPIVGYALVRQNRAVELLTAPGHYGAAHQMLARVCGDAIEHDRQDVVVCAPPGHALHRVVSAAGGTLNNHECDGDDVFMVKILEPARFIADLAPELQARARAADLPRDSELGLQVGQHKWRLVYTRRGMRLRSGNLGRSYLTLNRAEFTRLVLGHGHVREAAAAGRLQHSTQAALDLAEILFPRLPLWRPEWDDLPA